jgi:hypothetical protein
MSTSPKFAPYRIYSVLDREFDTPPEIHVNVRITAEPPSEPVIVNVRVLS